MIASKTALFQSGIRQRSLRKHCRLGRATELVFVLATGVMLTIGGAAQAADLVWDAGNNGDSGALPATGGAGNWEIGGSSTLWTDGTDNIDFTTGDSATFGAPGSYVVTIDAAGVTATNVTLTANEITIAGGDLAVSGQVISGAGVDSIISANVTGDLVTDIDVSGSLKLSGTVAGKVQTLGAGRIDLVNVVGSLDSDAGKTVIDGTAGNNGTVTGATTINDSTVQIVSGNLSAGDAAAVPVVAASTVTVNSGGTLDADGGSIGAVTLNTGGTAELGGSTLASFQQAAGFAGTTTMTAGEITGLTDIVAGTFTFDGGTLGNVANEGKFLLTSDQTIGGNYSGGGEVDIAGATGDVKLTVNGASGFATSGALGEGSNTLTIDSNIITLNAGVSFQGNVVFEGAVTNNAVLDVTAPITLFGTFTNNNKADLSAAITSSTFKVVNTGELNIDAGGTISGAVDANDGTVTVNAAQDGTKEIGGTVTVGSDLPAGTTGKLVLTNGDLGDIVNDGMTDTNGLNGTTDDTDPTNDGVEITITAGVVNSLTNNSGEAVLNGGTVTTTTSVSGGTVTNSGGALTGLASTSSTGTFTQTSGAANGGIENGGGTVNLDGGTAATLENVAGAGTSTVTDGVVSTTTTITTGEVVVDQTTADTALELAGDVTVAAAGTLTVTDGDVDDIINNGGLVTLTSGSAVTLDNNTVGADVGDVDIDGDFTIGTGLTNAGTLGVNSGTTTITTGDATNEASGVLTIATGAKLVTTAGTTSNAGTLIVDGTGVLDDTVTNQATGELRLNGGSVNGLVTNAGNVVLGGGALDGGLTNGGTIDGNGGTTTIAGNYTNSNGITNGVFAASAVNTVLTFDGTFKNSGDINAGTGTITINASKFTFTGASTLTGDVQFGTGTTFVLDGDQSGSDRIGAFDVLDGTTATNIGTFTNTGVTNIGDDDANAIGAELSASAIDNQNGATINVTTGSKITGTGNTTNNSGIVTVATGGSIVEVTGDYNNLATGDIDFNGTGAMTFDVQGATAKITNAGAIDFNAGITTVNSGDPIENNVEGTITVDNGATVTAAGDTLVNDATGATAGSEAIVTVEGTLTIDSITNQNGGRIVVNDDADALTTGLISGQIINSADLDINGGSVGGIDNNVVSSDGPDVRGDVDTSGIVTVDTGLTNAGDLDVNSGTLTVTTGGLNNETGGILTIADGASAVADVITNVGGISVGVGSTLEGKANTLNNTGTIDVATGGTVTDAGNINNNAGGIINFNGPGVGPATLNAGGAGTGIINNATATSEINVVAGDVTVGNDDVDTAGIIDVASGSTMSGLATLDQTGGTIRGGGTIGVTGLFQQTAGVTAGTIDINSGSFTQSGTSEIAAGTTVTSAGAQALNGGTIAGNLDGAGAITVASGTTSLTGAITNATNAPATNAGVIVSSGTLNETGAGSIDTANNLIAVSSGTLSTDGDGIADDETVNVSGTGFLDITGNDTIAALNQTGGTVQGGAVLTTGTFQQSGGATTVLAAGTTVTASGLSTLSGGTIAGTLNGAGNVTVQTAQTELTGSIDGGGIATVATGGTLNLNDGSVGKSLTLNGGTVSTEAASTTNTLNGATIVLSSAAGGTLLAANGTTLTVAPTGQLQTGGGTLTIGDTSGNNDGTVVLGNTSGAIGQAGSALDVTSGTLQFAAGSTAGSLYSGSSVTTQTVSVGATGTIDMNGQSTQLSNLSGDAGSVITSGVPGTANLSLNSASNTTFAGVIEDGSGTTAVTKGGGAGTLTMTAAQTYTGSTTVNVGELALTGAGALASTDVTINPNGTLSTDGGALAAAAGVLVGGGTFDVNGTETISHILSTVAGGGSITIDPAATVLNVGGNGTNSTIGGTTTATTVSGAGTLNIAGDETTIATSGDVQTATTIAAAGAVINRGNMETVSNAGELTNFATAGDITNTGTLTLSAIGMTASTTDSVTQNTSATAATNVEGDATVTGLTDIDTGSLLVANGNTLDAQGNVDIAAAATLTVEQNAAITTGAITNASTAASSNDGTVGVVNNSGVFNNTANGTVASLANSAGTFTNTGDITGASVVTGGMLQINGGTNGAVTNSGNTITPTTGIVNLTEGSIASLTNDANAGATTVTGGQVVGTTTINGGTVQVNDTTVDMNALELAGTTTVDGGILTVTAGDVGAVVNDGPTDLGDANDADEVIINGGGTVASLVNNTGETLVNGGEILGLSTINGGSLDVDEGIVGAITNAGGVVELADGTIASLTQNATGTETNVDGTGATVNGLIDIDTGTLNILSPNSVLANGGIDMASGTILNLSGAANGNVTNAGTLNVTGTTGSIGGNLTSTNEINLAGLAGDDSSTNSLEVTGDAVLTGNITIDASLQGTGNATNVSNFTGLNSLSRPGALTLTLGDLDTSAGGDFDNAVLFSFANGSSGPFTFDSFVNFPNQGALEYFVEDTGSALLLRTRTGAAVSSVAATIGLTQTLVNTIVNRPTSPFVADLAAGADEDPCGAGVWSRITGGTANADGSFKDVTADLNGTAPVKLNYSGLQLGGDIACFGGHYNGWDLAFGGIAGFNDANSSSSSFGITGALENVVDSDIFQKYAGVYVTAARGRFFADIQYRYEDTAFETTNTQVGTGGLVGFVDEEYDNVGQTLSGSVGYSWPVASQEGLTFVSSAGFSLSKNETDDVTLGTDGILTFEDGDSQVAFLSASVAKTTILPDELSLISYFGTATIYNDFASDRTATFTPTGGSARELALENLGAYGEVSLGVNYLKLLTPGQAGNARQLNASVRVDARFSDSVESYGITGQFRLQF